MLFEDQTEVANDDDMIEDYPYQNPLRILFVRTRLSGRLMLNHISYPM